MGNIEPALSSLAIVLALGLGKPISGPPKLIRIHSFPGADKTQACVAREVPEDDRKSGGDNAIRLLFSEQISITP